MKYILIFFVLMAGSILQAADGGGIPVPAPTPTPTPTPPPKFIKVDQDYFVDMQDGRVAGFEQVIGKSVSTWAPMRQIENTCDTNQVLSDCRLEMEVASRDIAVVWVKHPDSAKIGQVVKRYNANDPVGTLKEPLETKNFLLFWYDTIKNSPYLGHLKPDRLVCNNLDWAKNLATPNSRMTIQTWAIENMSTNPETGVNENQAFTSANNVVLQKVDNTTLVFESVGPSQAIGITPPYLADQIANLNFLDNTNKQCQVSFESSLTQAVKDITSVEFNKKDPSTRQPLRNLNILKNTSAYFYLWNAIQSETSIRFE